MNELTVEKIEAARDRLVCIKAERATIGDLVATKYILTGDVRQYMLERGYDTDEKIAAYLGRLGVSVRL